MEIHGYTTLLSPEAVKLPYLEALKSWASISDTISICYSKFPDLGISAPIGSSAPWEPDGSLDILKQFDREVLGNKLKIVEHIWDPNEPREDGFTKQIARDLAFQQVKDKDLAWLVHFDADELLRDQDIPKIIEAIESDNSLANPMQRHAFAITGILELFGSSNKVRFNFGNWIKIRMTRALQELQHGMPLRYAHIPVRGRNPRTGKIIAIDNRDDGAGFISAISLSRPDFNFGLWLTDVQVMNELSKLKGIPDTEKDNPQFQRSALTLDSSLNSDIWIYHTSWIDIARKWRMGWFFDNFWSVLSGKQDTFIDKAEKYGIFTNTRAAEGAELEEDLAKEMNRPTIKTINNLLTPISFQEVAIWRDKVGIPNRIPGINYAEWGL
jgi:hypothetical protein